MKWPRRVFVLTMDDLPGGPGCDINNNPKTPFLWMEAEIRNLGNTVSHLFLLSDAWTDRFVHIRHMLVSTKTEYELCDLYNAVWASFGYVTNQCPKALAIAERYKKLKIKKKPDVQSTTQRRKNSIPNARRRLP